MIVPAPDLRTRLRWWLGRHRRPLAAGCAGLAVWTGLAALRPAPPPAAPVLAASRDLPAGASLSPADVRAETLPTAELPAGSLRRFADIGGRPLSGPLRAGEPLTDARLAGPRALPPGTVAAPVRLADPAVAALLRPGDRVDLLALPARAGPAGPGGTGPDGPGSRADTPPALPEPARTVGAGLLVLAVPAQQAATGPADGPGSLLLLAADPATAARLAAAGSRGGLAVTIWR